MSDQLFETMQEMWNEYKNQPQNRAEITEKVLQMARTNPSDMWTVFFSRDVGMVKKLMLVENEQRAREVLATIIESFGNDAVIKMSATLANSYIESKFELDYGMVDEEKKQQWKSIVGSQFPEFNVALEKEIQYWIDWRAKSRSQYPTPAPQPTVEVLQFRVPMKCTDENGEDVFNIPQELINNMVEHYNQFRLDIYMDLTYKCNDTTLEDTGGSWLFKFFVCEPIPAEKRDSFVDEIKEKLAGQLSDGWGESMEQQGILVGDTEYYAGWDYQKIKVKQ